MTTEPTAWEKLRLQAHYRFSKLPFSKYMWARHMFDSESQRELLYGLMLWTELGGLALVVGSSGVGKSITLRRFVQELDESRHHVYALTYLPTTVYGFLRSLSRALGLPIRSHSADLFAAAQAHLVTHEQERGARPILLIDDGEGLTPEVFDVLRRLTCHDLDGDDRFSLVLSGTEELLRTLRHPGLDTLRSRVVFAQSLRPFGLEDTRNYMRFHLERADADRKLFSDGAIKRIFQVSAGRPRNINQLATQALIQGVVRGRELIDSKLLDAVITEHPLYHHIQEGD